MFLAASSQLSEKSLHQCNLKWQKAFEMEKKKVFKIRRQFLLRIHKDSTPNAIL